nr:hypothetical protein [Angustibacter aerolatus]
MSETEEGGHSLKKSVGAVGLTAMGVGAIIGTGIFVVIGEGADKAGPAVTLSFVLAALTCAFSALSYAEPGGRRPDLRLGVHVRLRHPRRAWSRSSSAGT